MGHFLIVINVITLIVVFNMIGTEFANKYHVYVAIVYWVSLIIGSIFLVKPHPDEWGFFPAISVMLFVLIALVSTI